MTNRTGIGLWALKSLSRCLAGKTVTDWDNMNSSDTQDSKIFKSSVDTFLNNYIYTHIYIYSIFFVPSAELFTILAAFFNFFSI